MELSEFTSNFMGGGEGKRGALKNICSCTFEYMDMFQQIILEVGIFKGKLFPTSSLIFFNSSPTKFAIDLSHQHSISCSANAMSKYTNNK